MIIRPTPSYCIELPESIEHDDTDVSVASFWLDGHPLLLQLSSYLRTDGGQATAAECLFSRKAKAEPEWKELNLNLCQDPAVDEACAEQIIRGVLWLHCYFVWPHLTIYGTVSGPPEEIYDEGNWALKALESLKLAVH